MPAQIIHKIKGKKIILFGETHGTKEIPNLLSKFFEDISKSESFNLCLEIPDEFQNQLDSYMKNGEDKELRSVSFFSKEYCTDGRNSLEYLNLINTIYKINQTKKEKIELFFICPSLAENQGEAEKLIAKNILDRAKNRKTFAVLGNIHASKKKINLFGKTIITAGFLINQEIKEKMFSILLKPESGKFFSNGLKEINYFENDSFDKNFDHVRELEKVSPCSFL